MKAPVWVAFGSNQRGPTQGARALGHLESKFGLVRPTLFRQWPDDDDPVASPYWNGSFFFESDLGMEILREHLREIENRLGRIRPLAAGACHADLDLVCLGPRVPTAKEIRFPHREVHLEAWRYFLRDRGHVTI